MNEPAESIEAQRKRRNATKWQLGPYKAATFRLPTDTLNAINAAAQVHGISKAQVIRDAVVDFCDQRHVGFQPLNKNGS